MESPKEWGWHEYQCQECHVLDEAYFEKHEGLLFTILRCCKSVIIDTDEQEAVV